MPQKDSQGVNIRSLSVEFGENALTGSGERWQIDRLDRLGRDFKFRMYKDPIAIDSTKGPIFRGEITTVGGSASYGPVHDEVGSGLTESRAAYLALRTHGLLIAVLNEAHQPEDWIRI